jgi:hypothetical protein
MSQNFDNFPLAGSETENSLADLYTADLTTNNPRTNTSPPYYPPPPPLLAVTPGNLEHNLGSLLDYQDNMARQRPAKRNADSAALDGQQPAVGGRNVTGNLTEQQIIQAQNAKIAALTQEVKAKKDPELNEGMCEMIRTAVSRNAWRTTKFLSGPKQIAKFAKDVYGYLDMTDEAREETPYNVWAQIYTNYCVTALNKTRSYVVSQLKKVSKEWMDSPKAKPENLPTLANILQCATRDIDHEDKESMEFFEWYVDQALPQATACAEVFGTTKQCFERVSECTIPGSETKLTIPASTEAFLVLVWEGFRTSWIEQYKYKAKNGQKAKIPRARGKDADVANKKYWGTLTNMDSGSKRLSGWSRDAMVKYAAYLKEIKKARGTHKCAQVETTVLPLLKAANDIEAETLAEYLGTKKKSKSKKVVAEPEEIDFGDDDEEE